MLLRLRGLILLSGLGMFACGQQALNSNSDDEELSKQGESLPEDEDPKFIAAFTVIKNQCIDCHSGYHNGWSSFSSSEKWISSGEITKGNSLESSLIKRLKNYDGNMPLGGAQLSEEDLNILLDWIDNL